MKKFESSLLEDLSIGDRFYFSDDKNKRVFEKQSQGEYRCSVKLIGGGMIKRAERVKAVVFLTSKTERDAL